jgi:2-hydroxymuconate-semialdehyde hydrolase
MSAITTRDVTVDAPAIGPVTFHLSESGPSDGTPLVFLHGSGPGVNALSNWEEILGDLGDTHHCLAPDIIGFGNSTHPDPPPQGLAAFTQLRVDTLLALFDHLGLDRVTLVGNSMGGIISLKLAMQAPERVDALVLMGTGGAPVGITAGLLQLITFYDTPTAENMADLLTKFVHDPSFFGDDLDKIAADRLPLALRPEVERSHRATFGPGEGTLGIDEHSVAALRQPVLVMHGEDDQIMSPAAGEWFAEHLPNARLDLITDTGHWIQIEDPDRFTAALREFLAERS